MAGAARESSERRLVSPVAGDWFDQLPAPAAILRRNGEAVQCNEEAVELLGLQPGNPVRLGRPGVLWFERLLDGVARSGRHRAMIRRRVNGTRLGLELRCQALEDGHILVLFTECRSRREFRAAAARLLRDQLRRSEEQLRHAQKMDAVGRLAAGVAHDFNNVLTAIHGHLQFLLDELPEQGTARDDALEIQRAADRAAELTRQLLTFARTRSNVPREVSLNSLVQGLEKLLQRLMRPGTRMVTAFHADLPTVWADAGQLEQVIVNLVINARDALGARDGAIVVRTSVMRLAETYRDRELVLAPGDYAVLTVTDNGCGMSAGMRRHVFEPFFTTKEQGTGLGLATAYGIIKQSGGHISVYSEEQVGTTFKVFLPALGEPTPGDTVRVDDETNAAGIIANRTILLADDDDAVRELVRRTLEREGGRILEAADGVQALNVAYRAAGIDIVVTDLIMPGIRGDELARRLGEHHPDAALVLISGFAEAPLLVPGDLRQRVHFLEKPFTPAMLLDAVRRAAPA